MMKIQNDPIQMLNLTPQKKTVIPALFFLQFIFFFHSIYGQSAGDPVLKLIPFGQEFERPVHAVFPEKLPGIHYVIQQNGVIFRIQDGKRSEFINISGFISMGGELGLLSMAVKNSYRENSGDTFYVNYTTMKPVHTVIAEVPVKKHPSGKIQGDFSKKRILLKFAQPYSNHNGGMMAFGSDGFLYIATGDGGSAGDPEGFAQNPRSLLGKILKIHPDKTQSGPYSLPADAPVIKGALPEIYAMGLRNPWRFSFDRKTGFLYAGDVGQNKIEEIDLIGKGGNYGWNFYEGSACFQVNSCKNKFILPIHEYGRNEGISVTGGYVYRGKKIPELYGKYIFSDFGSGNLWALALNAEGKSSGTAKLLYKNAGRISSFAEDPEGELYILDYAEGKMYQLN